MIDVSADTFRSFVDHNALISGLETALAARPRQAADSVPHAFVAAVGADLLHAASGDFGAMRVRWDTHATAGLAATTAATAMGGAVPVNIMLLAAILGRSDLVAHFREKGRFSLEAGLQWLVLHGICEHRLWHFVDGALRQALLRPVVNAWLTRMPALGVLVLRERPELKGRFIKGGRWQAEPFRAWLQQEGLDTYRLFWLAAPAELAEWPMRNWHKQPLSQPHASSRLSATGAQQIRQQAESAIQTHYRQIGDWHARDRLDVVTEMRPFSPAAQLLVNSSAMPSPDGWLTLPGGNFTIISPARVRHSPFIMVEMIAVQAGDDLVGAASLGGHALPVMLHRAGENCCLVLRVPAGLDHDPLKLLHVELSGTYGRAVKFDLIRIWNI
ncbi:hypothetical protein [Novosphingobium sp.]|uniref:hypothetical protein n=1 Tax=Novosphingobium sp. TaxID=1874826 RepID=UPI0031DDCD6E